MTNIDALEEITTELINTFEITSPPVPVEVMLKEPLEGMWEEVDINKLSGTFLKIKDVHSPRMSLARLLARHIVYSDWGKERNLLTLVPDEDAIHTFARMLIMPRNLLDKMQNNARTPVSVSMQFEVPEEDARIRLQEISQT
ncbi:MAG: hypothetical protein D6737_08225 [Chloroflexi bacterium]|nr:MAG: hypothetical protein CUN54_03610 [Phototrophicales bacterium]RMF80358.1 MAG: hypothetical protein D6737_08225 [Chloroflexota bacterium]